MASSRTYYVGMTVFFVVALLLTVYFFAFTSGQQVFKNYMWASLGALVVLIGLGVLFGYLGHEQENKGQ